MNQLGGGIMLGFGVTLVEAIIGATAAILVAGAVWTVRLLLKMDRAMKHMGGSLDTIYRVFPYLLGALRHQNTAFSQLGANGAVEAANECLDEADDILRHRHADLEKSMGTPGGC